eukprot:TRINITY_DN2017_c0_g1_i1.p1 TRINITY_DN2017_c0_g1~~TRINITY_DN2017_c0_g1_i1.p1  ORF type:complete len:1030 (+),score=257.71 TRINITY_DN2017_c0_g1_i1:67-3156(+)
MAHQRDSFASRASLRSSVPSFAAVEAETTLRNIFAQLDTTGSGQVPRDKLTRRLREPSVRAALASAAVRSPPGDGGAVSVLPVERLISRVGTWTAQGDAGRDSSGITWEELEAHANDVLSGSPKSRPVDGYVSLGGHLLRTDGLSQEQVATLCAFAGEVHDQAQDRSRLADALARAQRDSDNMRTLVAERDETITQLLAEEAADVQDFKVRQARTMESLQRRIDELVADLAARDAAARAAELRYTEQSSRLALLQIQLDEQRKGQHGGGDDVQRQRAEAAAADSEGLRARLSEAAEEAVRLKEALQRTETAKRDAEAQLLDERHRRQQQERDAEAAGCEYRSFRTKILEEMERHQHALDEAAQHSQDTLAQLQQTRTELVLAQGGLREANATAEELKLENARLREDLKNAQGELAAARKVEGMLHVDIRQLQIVQQERSAALAETRQRAQDDIGDIEAERQQMDALADLVEQQSELLRRMNDDVFELLGTRSAAPPSGPAVLPAEVQRVALIRDELSAQLGAKAAEQRAQVRDLERQVQHAAGRLAAEQQRNAGIVPLVAEECAGRLATVSDEEADRLRIAAAAKGATDAIHRAAWLAADREESERQHLLVTQSWQMVALAFSACHSGARLAPALRQLHTDEGVGREHTVMAMLAAARLLGAAEAHSAQAAQGLGRLGPDERLARAELERDEAAGFAQILALHQARREALSEHSLRVSQQRRAEFARLSDAESASRDRLAAAERGGRAALSIGLALSQTQLAENPARGNVEDLEDVEFGVLLMEFEEMQEREGARERAAAARRAKLKPQSPKKRTTAYLGVEVSEGIVVGRTDSFRGDHIGRDGKPTELEGVKVFSVAEGGPADVAGLQPEDLICSFNGQRVACLADFRDCAKRTAPGDVLVLGVRAGAEGPLEEVTLHTEVVAEEEWEPGRSRTIGYRVPVLARAADIRAGRAAREHEREQERQRLAHDLSSAARERPGSSPVSSSQVSRSAPRRSGTASQRNSMQSRQAPRGHSRRSMGGSGRPFQL